MSDRPSDAPEFSQGDPLRPDPPAAPSPGAGASTPSAGARSAGAAPGDAGGATHPGGLWSAEPAPGALASGGFAPPSSAPLSGSAGPGSSPLGGVAAPQPGPVGEYAPPPGGFDVRTAGGAAANSYVLAGWWRRVGATLIDGLIILLVALVVLAVVGGVFSVGFFAGEEAGAVSLGVGLVLGVLAVTVASLLYAPLLMARTNGQTLGRMATGIRVVRTSGEPMTFSWAMLREVAVKALLIGGVASSLTLGLAYLLDVLWPLWDEENRALHDFLVQTRTVLA